MNMLHNENCLDTMAKMSDNSIDMVLTSPPYDNLRKYKGYTFDFAPIAKELFRILKSGGTLVWVVNDQTLDGNESGTSFKQALYFKEIGFNLYDTMIWTKDGGGAIGSQRAYKQNFEYMFVLTKGVPKTINLIKDKPNKRAGETMKAPGRWKVNCIDKRSSPTIICKDFSVRNNYWYIPTQKSPHPAPFPERLARDHILTWSNPNDVVYDPFMGGGTTAVVCMRLNRNWIGSEVSSEYCKMINDRLDQENLKTNISNKT